MIDLGVSHQFSYQIHYHRHDNCEELNWFIELFCQKNNNIRAGVTDLTKISFIYHKIYLRSKAGPWLILVMAVVSHENDILIHKKHAYGKVFSPIRPCDIALYLMKYI